MVEHAGCSLAYDRRGAGPPVLLIQGVAVHGDGWRPQVDGLAACYRCLSFDNRGMGRSQPIGARTSAWPRSSATTSRTSPPWCCSRWAMRAYDATDRLAELSGLPTLVVSAVYDPIAPPRIGRALAAGIPGARYVKVPDASHGVPIQCADQVNALLLEHFASVP